MRSHPMTDALLAQVAEALAAAPLFRSLGPEERRQVVRRATLVEAQLGDAIVTEDDHTRDLFLMLSGQAAVVVRIPDTDATIEVGQVLPPEMFGELSLLLGEPRAATVVAHGPCRLLRLDPDAFREIGERVPGFALALSQELARRLRAALELRNELQRELVPLPSSVRRADISNSALYLARYYASAMQGVLRKHQLLVSGALPHYTDRFRFSREQQEQWFDLFGATGAERATPFTYFTASATMALMQALSDVGVNFRHLMHLKSEMSFNPEGRVLEPGRDYACSYRVADIIPLRSDRIALVSESEIRDADQRPMLFSKDFWIVKSLAPEYVAAVRRARRLGRHDAEQFQALSRRKPSLQGEAVRTREVFIPENMGVSYGRISGDMNMVHTTALAARLFGYRKPFIQGLCTANLVLQRLTGAAGRPPATFQISFCKQLFVGETVQIRHTDDRFEVCDGKGQLLAFGDWSPSALPSQGTGSPLAVTRA